LENLNLVWDTFIFISGNMSQEKLMWSEENIDILKHLVKESDGGRFMVALGKDSQKNHIYLKR